MDNKEIKSLLKQARDAIKEKEYSLALKHCKAVLKYDKNNYNAWVFAGVAAQETDQLEQSEAAFLRAVDISPDQLLAWQGLCNFYERQNNHNKLIEVYKKLLNLLSNDRTKQLEILDKFLNVAKTTGSREKIIEALELQLELVKGDDERESSVWKAIFQTLCEEKCLTAYLEQLQNSALQKILNCPSISVSDCKSIIRTYIRPLYEGKTCDQAITLAKHIYEKYPDCGECLEFLSKAALDIYVQTDNIMQDLEAILQNLCNDGNHVWLCEVVQGLMFFTSKKYIEAIQKLKKGIKLKNDCVQSWYLLCKVQLFLHLYCDAEKSSKAGLRLAVKYDMASDIIGRFYLFLGQALAGRKLWDAALKAFEKCVECEGRTPEVLKVFSFTLLKMDQLDKAEKICIELRSDVGESAEVLQIEGYIELLKGNHSESLQKLRTSLSLKESAFTLHLIAVVLWKMEQQEKAYKIFLKAAELDPYFPKNFLYLGHYYRSYMADKNKSRLCYQKAFDLDPSDEEAGILLSNILKELGDDEANIGVLKTITQQASLGSCKWAWTQLGLYQLDRNEFLEAVFSLQNAVRADPSNSYGWECLGDAYFKRGSYESALKAFEKAAELNPKAMYPLYQISNIQKIRGLYVEAVEKYKDLVKLESTYVPALIGLAETLTLLGKKYFNECLFGRAKVAFEEALNVLSRVASSNSNLSCLWKLAGDACTFLFYLGNEWFPIAVASELLQNSENSSAAYQKKEILAFGAKFYGRALCIKPYLNALWHDLGINYYFQSLLYSLPESSELAKKAFLCLQKAISLSPSYHTHWTAFGVICANKAVQDSALAQHAFIKSMVIERNNSEAWTNLGVLYLEKQNIKMAHNAFKIAQSLDPTYPLCWIGQAMIADSVKHTETLDLFRHATTLGSHPQALLGYSKIVCQTLLDTSNRETELYTYNIEQMDAVVVALDCIIKYTSNNENCPEAFNILGMLLERQMLYSRALKSFKRALDMFEQLEKIEEKEKVHENFARLLTITGHSKEAILEYLKLKKSSTPLLCCFGYALYKNKQFEKAFDVFSGALKITNNAVEKSHIIVAKAMIAKKMQHSDKPDALKLLFESSQVKPPSIHGLLALYAIGIFNRNLSLAAAAQTELQPFKYHHKYGPSVALLSAAHLYVQNGIKSARNQLLKAIHCQPNNSILWLQTSSYMLQCNSEYAAAAATCSQVAVIHGGNKELASQVFALCQLSVGYKKVSLHAAQKALHIHPDKLSNWATLTAACHVVNKDRKHIGWIFGFVKKLAREQGIKSDLLGWLVAMEIFHYIYCKDITAAASLVKQALSASSFSTEFQTVFQILNGVIAMFLENGKLDSLVLALKSYPKSFLVWHVLLQILLHLEKFMETEKTIRQFLLATAQHFPRWTAFPLLLLSSLSYRALNADINNEEKWLALGKESVEKAVTLAPNNQAARFIQGLFAVKMQNSSLARRSFERVLYNVTIKESKWMEKMSAKLLVPVYLKRKDKEALQKLINHYPELLEAKSALEKLPKEDIHQDKTENNNKL